MAKSSCLREIRNELLRPGRAHVPVAGREVFPEGPAIGCPQTGSVGAVTPLQAMTACSLPPHLPEKPKNPSPELDSGICFPCLPPLSCHSCITCPQIL